MVLAKEGAPRSRWSGPLPLLHRTRQKERRFGLGKRFAEALARDQEFLFRRSNCCSEEEPAAKNTRCTLGEDRKPHVALLRGNGRVRLTIYESCC